MLDGRARLHNIVYLLDLRGFGSGVSFDYGSYGVYSKEIDVAICEAHEGGIFVEQRTYRTGDGAEFRSYYAVAKQEQCAFGDLNADQLREIVGLLAKQSITVLEFAVCIDWYWRREKCADWRSEIERRKTARAKGERLEKAIDLLRRLGLNPPQIPYF